ncbi:MAG: carboxyl transferase domain-containing protein, partial [Chloroflexota bacterium]
LAEAKDGAALLQQWRKEYEEKYLDIYKVGPFRHFDDMIDPADTRRVLIRALEITAKKKVARPWRKHGNMPV